MRGSSDFWGTDRNGLVLAGMVVSVIFWLLEAGNHVVFFGDSGVFEALFAPASHELWMRLIVVGVIMVFAFIANNIVMARRQAEEAAKVALAELDQIFETAADGMRIVGKDFRVLKANETFAALVGLPKHEVVGGRCDEVFGGECCGTPACPLTRVLNGDEQVEYDADKIRVDGTAVPCIVTATPFRRPDGEIVGIVEDFKDISQRKQSERELRETGRRLRELAAHLQGIREQERSRIARELHDELGQALTALGLEMRLLKTRLPVEHLELHEKTRAMTEIISATADSVRRICSELRPALLDHLGLAAAIEWQAEEFTQRTGIACDIESTPAELKLPGELSVAVFRVFQETLTNIARHAHASEAEIRLQLTPGEFRMRVCDDGVGMEGTGERKVNSFGLLGVKERVRGFGGEVTLSPGCKGGTCLEVVIPTGGDSA